MNILLPNSWKNRQKLLWQILCQPAIPRICWKIQVEYFCHYAPLFQNHRLKQTQFVSTVTTLVKCDSDEPCQLNQYKWQLKNEHKKLMKVKRRAVDLACSDVLQHSTQQMMHCEVCQWQPQTAGTPSHQAACHSSDTHIPGAAKK